MPLVGGGVTDLGSEVGGFPGAAGSTGKGGAVALPALTGAAAAAASGAAGGAGTEVWAAGAGPVEAASGGVATLLSPLTGDAGAGAATESGAAGAVATPASALGAFAGAAAGGVAALAGGRAGCFRRAGRRGVPVGSRVGAAVATCPEADTPSAGAVPAAAARSGTSASSRHSRAQLARAASRRTQRPWFGSDRPPREQQTIGIKTLPLFYFRRIPFRESTGGHLTHIRPSGYPKQKPRQSPFSLAARPP